MDALWRMVQCSRCGGHGQVSAYTHGDFEGPRECRDCDGRGFVYIRPSGHLFTFPGGRALGRTAPSAYVTAQPCDEV